MNAGQTDIAVIADSIAEAECFGRIFDRHYRSVHCFATRRLGSALADDVAAETFARAFKSRAKFASDSGSALPWLYGIASNVMRMHSRGEVRRLRAYARTGIDPVEDFSGSAADRASADAGRTALLGALAKLGRRDRELVLLAAWTDLSSSEIGEALDMPDTTVLTRLARARKKLAQTPELRPGPDDADLVMEENR